MLRSPLCVSGTITGKSYISSISYLITKNIVDDFADACGVIENGLETVASLLSGFAVLGGHFMQLDVADTEILKEAQKHPEDYQTLSVRISGWNARFVTLNKEWQDMIIAQRGSNF